MNILEILHWALIILILPPYVLYKIYLEFVSLLSKIAFYLLVLTVIAYYCVAFTHAFAGQMPPEPIEVFNQTVIPIVNHTANVTVEVITEVLGCKRT
jgi:hypothetical protein